MKKVLAVFLAALMMFATFGMTSFAEDVVEIDPTEPETLDEILDYVAARWTDSTGTVPTVLVFNPNTAKVGMAYEGKTFPIKSGKNKGCTALVGENFVPGNPVQLPNVKNAPDGYAGSWRVLTEGIESSGRTYGSGSIYVIPEAMKERVQANNYIVFYAEFSPNEETSVLSKIMGIFYKVISVLSQDLADQFYNMLVKLGLEIELD